MKKFILSLIIISPLLTSSCIYEYDISGKIWKDKETSLVINSLFHPDQTISIALYKSKLTNDQSPFVPLQDLRVILYSGNQLLVDTISGKELLTLPVTPDENKSLRIVVKNKDGKDTEAIDVIPQINKTEFTGEIIYNDVSGIITEKNLKGRIHISGSIKPNACWIQVNALTENNESIQTEILKVNYPFIDPINQLIEETNGGTTLYHEYFLRIAPQYLQTDLLFEFETTQPYQTFGSIKSYEICIITAGEAYDRYRRTRYQQERSDLLKEDFPPIFDNQVSVYSNIRNGLGIFAGYQIRKFYIEIKNRKTEHE